MIDATLRPSRFTNSLGGPFNGQIHRLRMVERLLKSGIVDRIVETGSFRGDTTEFLACTFPGLVITIEENVEYAKFTSIRLRRKKNVRVMCGDSAMLLREALRVEPAGTTFVYLDAHWGRKLPLRDELLAVKECEFPVVVMIDDFEVPGDTGYGFDEYGEVGRLSWPYIADLVTGWFTVFWPAVSSTQESGARRGCCVLARGEALKQWLVREPYLRMGAESGAVRGDD